MLINSFCLFKNITFEMEREIWENGIKTWYNYLDGKREKYKKSLVKGYFLKQVEESVDKFELKEIDYFFEKMPREHYWRFFKEFSDKIGYLDIETSGLEKDSVITLITLYFNGKINCFLQGKNLHDFPKHINKPRILVTYGGNVFDIPMIESYFGIKLFQRKIDIKYFLNSLGLGGGLKICEKKLGIKRGLLEGFNGSHAALLWKEYRRYKSLKYLNTLLAYNITDTVNLEKISFKIYNMFLQKYSYPFEKIAQPKKKEVPFIPNLRVIRKIKKLKK